MIKVHFFFDISYEELKFMMSEGIRINTTQNVVIDYEQAGLGARMLAAILDFVFLMAYFILAMLITSNFIDVFEMSPMKIMAIYSIINLPLMTYSLYMESFFNGQTLGKKILKIKVVKLDGTQPGIGAFALRWIIRLIDVVLSNGAVAVLTVGFSKNSQRIGDMAAGTTVVSIKQKVSLKQTILQKNNPDYKIVFQEVNKLSDKDVGIIKEVFDYCAKNGDYSGLSQLAKKVKAKMDVTTTLKDVDFIKVVLMDYSQYQFEK